MLSEKKSVLKLVESKQDLEDVSTLKDTFILKLKKDLEILLLNIKKSRELEDRKLYNDVILRHPDLYLNLTYGLEEKVYHLI